MTPDRTSQSERSCQTAWIAKAIAAVATVFPERPPTRRRMPVFRMDGVVALCYGWSYIVDERGGILGRPGNRWQESTPPAECLPSKSSASIRDGDRACQTVSV